MTQDIALTFVRSAKMARVPELGISTDLVYVFLFSERLTSNHPVDDLVEIVDDAEDKGTLLCEITSVKSTKLTHVLIKQKEKVDLTEAEQLVIGRKGMDRALDGYRSSVFAFADHGLHALDLGGTYTSSSVATMKQVIAKRSRRERLSGVSVTYAFYRPSGAIACLL